MTLHALASTPSRALDTTLEMSMPVKHLLPRLLAPLLCLSVFNPVAAQVETLDEVVAIVDDDVILSSELQERLAGVKMSLERRGIELPEEEVLVRQTLDRLILESIQLQLADRYGVRIPDAQLDQSMQRVAAQNGLSLEQFRAALEAQGQSYVLMRENMRQELAIQRVQQGNVMRNINLSEQEIDNFMATEEGQAMTQPEYNVTQVLLEIKSSDSSDEVAAKEAFVDGVLASILAGKPFEEAVSMVEPYAFTGGALGWRRLDAIPSMFAEIVPTLGAGDTGKVRSGSGFHLVHLEDVRGRERLVAQTEVRHILIIPSEVMSSDEAKALLRELRERIQGGEDFALLAKEYSDDIGTAAEGGDLGWTNPGEMVAEFESQMAQAEIGAITEPFESQFGWHILEVTDRREKDFSNEMRRNQVANYLREQKYQEELDAWLREIREEAFVDIK
jgi:peptidyl-prolyl cis-trans isomerase SurA